VGPEAQLYENGADLILLDVSLPDGNGFQLCSRLQHDDTFRNIPVIFLTAHTATADKITAFSVGADDYIEKPFDAAELRARIESKLKKRQWKVKQAEVLRRGALRLDVTRYRAYCLLGDTEKVLDLTAREFRILHHLATREGRIVTREQLLQCIWDDAVVVDRTVDTHVSNLRRKLGDLGEVIETVRGVGYRFITLKPEAILEPEPEP